MFRTTVILCTIAAQVLAAPKPNGCIEACTTYSTQQTHEALVQQQTAMLNQLQQAAASQISGLEFSRPGNWTEHNEYRTDGGRGRVVEEQGQVVTGPRRVQYYRKNYSSSHGVNTETGGLGGVGGIDSTLSSQRLSGGLLGGLGGIEAPLDSQRIVGSTSGRGSVAHHSTYDEQHRQEVHRTSNRVGSHSQRLEDFGDRVDDSQQILHQVPTTSGGGNWHRADSWRTDGGRGVVHEEEGQVVNGPTKVEYYRQNYSSSYSSGDTGASVPSVPNLEDQLRRVQSQLDSFGREVHRQSTVGQSTVTQTVGHTGYVDENHLATANIRPLLRDVPRVVPEVHHTSSTGHRTVIEPVANTNQRYHATRDEQRYQQTQTSGSDYSATNSQIDDRRHHRRPQTYHVVSEPRTTVRKSEDHHVYQETIAPQSQIVLSDSNRQIIDRTNEQLIRTPIHTGTNYRSFHSNDEVQGNRLTTGHSQRMTAEEIRQAQIRQSQILSQNSQRQDSYSNGNVETLNVVAQQPLAVNRYEEKWSEGYRSHSTVPQPITSGQIVVGQHGHYVQTGQTAGQLGSYGSSHNSHSSRHESGNHFYEGFRTQPEKLVTSALTVGTIGQTGADCDQSSGITTSEQYQYGAVHHRKYKRDAPKVRGQRNQQVEDLTQQTADFDDFYHQHSGKLELGQHAQQTEDLTQQTQQSEDLTQQTSGFGDFDQQTSGNLEFGHQHQQHSGKLEFGQHTQQTEDLTQQTQHSEDLTQQTSGFGDFGQQTSGNLEFGQQHQQHSGKLEFGQHTQQTEDLTQQTQQSEDFTQQTSGNLEFGQQHQQHSGKLEFGQHTQQTEDLTQQTQQSEDFTQQTSGNLEFGQQHQQHSGKLEFGQHTQQTEDLTQQTQQSEDLSQQTFGHLEFGHQQQQQHSGKLELGQETQQTQKMETVLKPESALTLDFDHQTNNSWVRAHEAVGHKRHTSEVEQSEDLTQQTSGHLEFGQQQQQHSRKLEFGQETQQIEDLTQQTSGHLEFGGQHQQHAGKLEFGQETQQTEDLTPQTSGHLEFGQHHQQHSGKLEFGQETQQTEDLTPQTSGHLEFGQHHQQHSGKLEFGQETQQTEDLTPQTSGHLEFGQQHQQHSGKLEFGQETQQTEDLTPQTSGHLEFGQQHQQHSGKLEFGQETQQTEDLTPQTSGHLEFGQQHQQHSGKLEFGQETQQTEDLTPQTSGHLEFGQQHQQHSGKLEFGQETQQTEDWTHQTSGHLEFGQQQEANQHPGSHDFGYQHPGSYDFGHQHSGNYEFGHQQHQHSGNHEFGQETQQTEDLTQQIGGFDDFMQQTSGNLQFGQQHQTGHHGFGQETQQTGGFDDFMQQTSGNLQFGQQHQTSQHGFGQETQQTEDITQQIGGFDDFTQQTSGNLQFGHQHQTSQHGFGQETQQTEDMTQQTGGFDDFTQQTSGNLQFGHQHQTSQHGFGQETQQTEDMTQQTGGFDDFTQQTSGNLQFGHQHQTSQHGFGQETQQTEDMTQQTGGFDDFTQQSSGIHDFGQERTTTARPQTVYQPGVKGGRRRIPAPKPTLKPGRKIDIDNVPKITNYDEPKLEPKDRYNEENEDTEDIPTVLGIDESETHGSQKQATNNPNSQWHQSHHPGDLTNSENLESQIINSQVFQKEHRTRQEMGHPDFRQNRQSSPVEGENSEPEFKVEPRIIEVYGGAGSYDVDHNDDLFSGAKQNPSATIAPIPAGDDPWDIREKPVEAINRRPIYAQPTEETTTEIPTTTAAPSFWSRVGHKITNTYEKAKEKATSIFGK